MVSDIGQIARIAIFEAKVLKTCRLGTCVAGIDQVSGNVDPQDICAVLGQRQGRCPVATTEVEHSHLRGHTERVDKGGTRLAHEGFRDGREVTLFPQLLIWIGTRLFCHGVPLSSWKLTNGGGATIKGSGTSNTTCHYFFPE